MVIIKAGNNRIKKIVKIEAFNFLNFFYYLFMVNDESRFEYYRKIKDVEMRSHTWEYWKPDTETRNEIEEKWQEKLRKNPNAYSGDLLRVKDIEYLHDGTMEIDTQLSTYKEHRLTMDKPDLNKRGNCLHVSGDIITSDEKLVFGLDDGLLKLIGGGVQPKRDLIFTSDYPRGKPNPEMGLYREVWEEIGINPLHYNSLTPDHTVVTPEQRHPEIMYKIELSPDSKAVEDLFQAYKTDCKNTKTPLEINEVVCLSENEIPNILEDFKTFSPKQEAEIGYIQGNIKYFLNRKND